MTTRHPGDRHPDRLHVHRRVPHGGARVLVQLRDLSRLLTAVPDLLETPLGKRTVVVLGLRRRQRGALTTNRLILPALTNLPRTDSLDGGRPTAPTSRSRPRATTLTPTKTP